MREWLTEAFVRALKDLALASGLLLAVLQGAARLLG